MKNRRMVHILNYTALLILINSVVLSCSQSQVPTQTPTFASTNTTTPTFTPLLTDTPFPTNTPEPTSTSTPTYTPSKTPTATAIPKPDPKAMLDWQALELPSNFESYFQESFGIQEGAVAFQGESDEGSVEFVIENSFLFGNDVFTDFLYGYTINLAGDDDIDIFDDYIDHSMEIMANTTAQGVLAQNVTVLSDIDQIGDHSQALTVVFPFEDRTDRLDNIDFRVGNIGASVFVRYLDSSEPAVSVEELAKVYEQSIQIGFQSCRIVSVTPVTGAYYPTFKIEAEGFYPVERRTIILTGEYKIDGEIKSAATALMGQSDDADLTTKEGEIKAVIALDIEGLEGDVEILDEFEITVQGQYSGCEVKRKVTWPGE